MHSDPASVLPKKRDLPLKQFFLFPSEKQASSSPTRGVEPRYFFNSNYLVSSTKNATQTPSLQNSLVQKNFSKKSLDRTAEPTKKVPGPPSKIRIIPRQNMASAKQLIIKDFSSASPPKDLKTLTTVSRLSKGPSLPERVSVVLDPLIRSTSNGSPLPNPLRSPKYTKLRIVSRDKTNQPPAPIVRPPMVVQKEPLHIRKQADQVSPKTKQRIDFCIKLDKIVSVKARSNDIKKTDVSAVPGCGETKKRNHMASEDKDQIKYMVQDSGLRTIPNETKGKPHAPIFHERRELAKNKFFAHLKSRYQDSEEVGHVATRIAHAFSDWRQTKAAEFFAFKTPVDFYRIKYKIGKGCFGKVYLATQLLTGCDVALKVIAKTNIKNKDTRRKIEKEVAILKQVNSHRAVIKLLEVFEDEASVYLVFEHLPNGDLVQYFKKKPLFEEPELAPFFMKVLRGVRYLHANRILHRDLKLDNILLDKALQPKLCDFGISSVVEEGVKIYDTGGTPAYLAPEVIKAEGHVCEKSDVWSLGVLLYLLTFGIVPFKANDMQVLYNKIIVGTFKFPDIDDTSKELLDLIRRMLVVDVDRRLSLDQVMRHPWFRGVVPEVTQEFNLLEEQEEAVNQAVLNYMHLVGFPEEFISKTVSKGVFNHVKACVDTLRAKFLKY